MVSISSIASKGIGKITTSKPMKALCNYFQKDPEKALAYTTVGSIVAKDGIGCAMYVYQSMNNKEIPEKRRNFVAALDLTNGILMIVSQIAMFFAMRKFNETLFPKLLSKSFDKQGVALKNITEQVRINQAREGIKPSKKFVIGKEYDKIKKDCFETFKFVTELAAATIVGKRIIVPFIATPLAQKVEKKMNEKSALEEGNTLNNAQDKSNPTMKGAMKETPVVHTLDTGSTNLLARYKK